MKASSTDWTGSNAIDVLMGFQSWFPNILRINSESWLNIMNYFTLYILVDSRSESAILNINLIR